MYGYKIAQKNTETSKHTLFVTLVRNQLVLCKKFILNSNKYHWKAEDCVHTLLKG